MKLFRLIFIVLGLVSIIRFDTFGQDNLKQQFDQFIDNNSVKKSKKIQKDSINTASIGNQKLNKNEENLTSTEKNILTSNDSITNKVQEGNQVVLAFDTTSFQERQFSVKGRKPKEDRGSEVDWEKLYSISSIDAYKKKHELDSSFKVFGWHPYWMGGAYKSYNFSLLSAIAYFSYELNPVTGDYYTVHDWHTTNLVDSAHKHGTKVLLSVTNFGGKNNALFLGNKEAQKKLIGNIITLLRARNGDGINLDFEGIPKGQRNALLNFIIDLSTSLRAANKDYLITLAIPAVDFDGVYDFNQLNGHVDLFVVMGYEFYGSTSKVAGPVAPLTSGKTWWSYNLERSINEYLISGVEAKKLLLGLPYYGAEWETRDLQFPSSVTRFIRYRMYRDIIKTHGDLKCCDEQASASKFHVYRDQNNNYRQVWFDDSTSLAKKYDWIKNKKIGGVGIWALGYDNGYNELWKLLASKFAVQEKKQLEASLATGVKEKRSKFSMQRFVYLALRVMRNPKTLLTNPRPLIGIFGSIFGLSMIGFFLLYRYGCRFKNMVNLTIKGTITLLIVILVALIFIATQYSSIREVAYLLGGFLIGSLIFLIFSRRFLVEKDLP